MMTISGISWRSGERKIIGIGAGSRRPPQGWIRPSRWICRSAKPSPDAESIFVGIIHDLTERKADERQLQQAQKMEMVDNCRAASL